MTIKINDITAKASGLLKSGSPGGDSGWNPTVSSRERKSISPFNAWMVSHGSGGAYNIYNYLYIIMCLLWGSNTALVTRAFSNTYGAIASFLRNEYRVFYDSKATIASFLRRNSEFFTIFLEKRVFYDFTSISQKISASRIRIKTFFEDFTAENQNTIASFLRFPCMQ